MENEHSLKNWVRKHSPLKHKNLPPQPAARDGIRPSLPLDPISANISPSRRPSKIRLRSLLKSKTQQSEAGGLHPTDQLVPAKQLRRQSMPLMTPPSEQQSKNTLRRGHHPSQSTDLQRLSVKISNLEAQLKEAKEELDSAARHRSARDWPQPQPPQHNHSTIRSIPNNQQDLNTTLPDAEFVRNLLIQREQDFRTSGMASRSTTDLSYEADSSFALASSGPEILDQTQDPLNLSPNQHKRKRSQVRQASWDQVQTHLQQRQSRCIRQQVPEAKRMRRDPSRSHGLRKSQSKDLPGIPDFPMPNVIEHADSQPNFFIIVDPSDDVEELEHEHDPHPPLDRHQRHFSQPPELAPPDRPKPTKHRRSRSQIIDLEEVRQLSPSRPDDLRDPARPPSRKGGGGNCASRPANPPSPTRRTAASPIRLERVQEEYEWDEEVF